MTLRMLVASTSSYAAAAAPAAAGAADPGWAFSTSSLVTAPPRPEPLMFFRATPFSSASFLTAGEYAGWRWREVSRRAPLESDSWETGASSLGGAVLEPVLAGSLA